MSVDQRPMSEQKSPLRRRRSGMARAATAAVVVLVAAGGLALGSYWRQTETSGLTLSTGISDDQILAQFEVETIPPSAPSAERRNARSAASIIHPDPLGLPSVPLRLATTSSGALTIEEAAKAFRTGGYRGTTDLRQVSQQTALNDLCQGRVDLIQIDESPPAGEVERCPNELSTLVHLTIALDRIVLVAHPDNFWLGDIRADQLGTLLRSTSWSDIDPQWPRRPISKHLPDKNSSEMIAITEAAGLTGVDLASATDDAPALDVSTSYHAEPVDRLDAVAADPEAIALVSMADLRSTRIDFVLRPIGLVDPITALTYPVQRPVRLVMTEQALTRDISLQSFVAFYLNRIERIGPLFNLPAPPDIVATRREFVERLPPSTDAEGQTLFAIEGDE